MEKKERMHGYEVLYESDMKDAIAYLGKDLQEHEARVFFDQAKRHERDGAPFETGIEGQYILFYNEEDRTYRIEKQKKSSGWF